ncbi:MAG: thioesterase [Gammaproteobacteria bacterium RIFCSPHIGHO2_12_FULL_63_22]|nr:MAG: thioesterase [Gammaproteobacteria bacterium RIFCSPHIGHO2_12_FULL_63_22]
MRKIIFTLVMPVRWRDLDAFKHVNNASYLGYIEEARVSWFRSLSSDWSGETAAPILAAVTLNYRRPANWPETLIIELIVERIGNKSLTLDHRITSATDEGVLYADGNSVMVWVDGSGQSIVLPPGIRAACE